MIHTLKLYRFPIKIFIGEFDIVSSKKMKFRVLLLIASIYLLNFSSCFFESLLFIEGPKLGFLEEFGVIAQHISVYFMIIISQQFPENFNAVFSSNPLSGDNNSIMESIAFTDSYPESSYKKDVESVQQLFDISNPKGKLIYYLLSGLLFSMYIFAEIHILGLEEIQSWGLQNKYKLVLITQFIQSFMFWCIFYPYILYSIGIAIFGLMKMINQIINKSHFILSPISSGGGLDQISNYCLLVIKILFFPLIIMFAWYIEIGFTIFFAFSLLLYLFLLGGAFFYPLFIIHNSLTKVKNNELQKIESRFINLFREYSSGIKNEIEPKNNRLDDISQQLLSLQEIYTLVSNLPVWPYRSQTLSRFISWIILPFIFFAIQMISNADSILFNLDKLNKLLEPFIYGNPK